MYSHVSLFYSTFQTNNNFSYSVHIYFSVKIVTNSKRHLFNIFIYFFLKHHDYPASHSRFMFILCFSSCHRNTAARYIHLFIIKVHVSPYYLFITCWHSRPLRNEGHGTRLFHVSCVFQTTRESSAWVNVSLLSVWPDHYRHAMAPRLVSSVRLTLITGRAWWRVSPADVTEFTFTFQIAPNDTGEDLTGSQYWLTFP